MTRPERAPAKVNLCLHVTGQRSDGYHLLDSLVVFTALGDCVSVRPLQGLSLSISGPEGAGLSAGADNLVLRAARMMGARDMALTLDKHLPRAAGIGGGSSDAAATLRLLARATGQPLPGRAALVALGADVPVCLTPRPTRMRGIGERLDPLPPLPDFALVLVNPRVDLPTPEAFGALERRDNSPLSDPLGPWPDLAGFLVWLRAQRNDLQAPACRIAPVISNVLEALQSAQGCALARMSGSGATCFGVFETLPEARAAARALQRAHPDWWCEPTALLPAESR